jgi:hypothetical protein
MERLADGFARERGALEGQWSRGEDVSTEDLRVTLQDYRSFFRRLALCVSPTASSAPSAA